MLINVSKVIRQFCGSIRYMGYYYIEDAVKIVIESQKKPVRITKDIYPVLASKYHSTDKNIEHNMRNYISICWENNKPMFDQIAGRKLLYRPTNYEFIDMITCYVLDHSEDDGQSSRQIK